MNESVFVSDLQPRHPPALHIRMISIRHMDASPAAQPRFVAMIEELNAVQVMQVPQRGRVLAIDFERVERLVASRVTGGLKRRQRSVPEPAEKSARVIDANF